MIKLLIGIGIFANIVGFFANGWYYTNMDTNAYCLCLLLIAAAIAWKE